MNRDKRKGGFYHHAVTLFRGCGFCYSGGLVAEPGILIVDVNAAGVGGQISDGFEQ
ncbi:hypothetical protein ACFL3I_11605 [Pseudomonadota bacterium]